MVNARPYAEVLDRHVELAGRLEWLSSVLAHNEPVAGRTLRDEALTRSNAATEHAEELGNDDWLHDQLLAVIRLATELDRDSRAEHAYALVPPAGGRSGLLALREQRRLSSPRPRPMANCAARSDSGAPPRGVGERETRAYAHAIGPRSERFSMKIGRLLLRLLVGGFFVGHGTQKLFGWFGGHGLEGTAAGFEQLGLHPGRRNAIAAGAAEAGGGLFLATGLATPVAASALTAT